MTLVKYESKYSEKQISHIKESFKDLTPDSHVALVLRNETIYYSDSSLSLRDIIGGEDLNQGYLFFNGKLYFTATKDKFFQGYTLFVYECNIDGSDKKLIYEKTGFYTHPWVVGNGNIFYISYRPSIFAASSDNIIDSYNILTNEYSTVAEGVELSNYSPTKTVYSRKYLDDGTCIFTNTETNAVISIGSDVVASSDFAQALPQYRFTIRDYYCINDRIYAICEIEDLWIYSCVICEYDLEEEQLKFRSLVFPYDSEPMMDIVYIN